VACLLEQRRQPFPTPRTMPGPVHQAKRRHQAKARGP
jgi:hypothetical protein